MGNSPFYEHKSTTISFSVAVLSSINRSPRRLANCVSHSLGKSPRSILDLPPSSRPHYTRSGHHGSRIGPWHHSDRSLHTGCRHSRSTAPPAMASTSRSGKSSLTFLLNNSWLTFVVHRMTIEFGNPLRPEWFGSETAADLG